MVLGIIEQVLVGVRRKIHPFFPGQSGQYHLIECPRQFLHEMQGELSSFAGPLHLLVSQLRGGFLDPLVICQSPASHQGVQRLEPVIACRVLHADGLAYLQPAFKHKIRIFSATRKEI